MDIRKVKKLIELLEESGIAEIEITEGEEAVRISRYGAAGVAPVVAAPVQMASPVPVMQQAAPAAAATEAQDSAVADGHAINAPMVGTYYSAPTPGTPPFVEIGTSVTPGQTLCIIEAMKMMNQIDSDRSGRITAILAENGDPVEFGQPLFIIE